MAVSQNSKILASDVAPKSHANSATTYGIGTSSNYGHVKLSDSTSSTSAASAGIAASPKAVKAAYDLASKAFPLDIMTAGAKTNSVVITQSALGTYTYTFTKNFYGNITSSAQITLIPDTGASKSVTVTTTIGSLTDTKTQSSNATATATLIMEGVFIPANSTLTVKSSSSFSYTLAATSVTITGYLK